MTDFMLDIETTGLNPCVNHITSCAIVPFELSTGQYSENNFHQRFDRTIVGRLENKDTMYFRAKYNIDKAEKELPISENIYETMRNISKFLNDANTYVWAKPAHFDIAFLASYFNMCSLPIPWSHRNARDLGTYLAAAGHKLTDLYKEIEFTGDTHNALHDCYYQILIANLGYRNLQKLAG